MGKQDPWWLGSKYFVSIAETDIEKFRRRTTPKSLRNLIRALHGFKATLSPDEFDEKSSAYGWNYNPWSLALDPEIGELDKITVYDWAHCYLIDGLLDVEFGLCIKWLHKNTNTRYAELWEYAQTFTWPRGRAEVGHLFTDALNAKYIRTGNFNCTASEMLTLCPVLHRFFLKMLLVREGALPVIVTLLAVLDVIELLQGIKANATQPEDLAKAIKNHLDLFIEAYGKKRNTSETSLRASPCADVIRFRFTICNMRARAQA